MVSEGRVPGAAWALAPQPKGPGTCPATDGHCLRCRREGEGSVHHSRSWRRGPHDRQHADEEHGSSGQERPDALKAALMKLQLSGVE